MNEPEIWLRSYRRNSPQVGEISGQAGLPAFRLHQKSYQLERNSSNLSRNFLLLLVFHQTSANSSKFFLYNLGPGLSDLSDLISLSGRSLIKIPIYSQIQPRELNAELYEMKIH